MKNKTKVATALFLGLAIWLANSSRVVGQEKASPENSDDGPDCSLFQSPYLSIWTNERGIAGTFLTLCYDASRENQIRQDLPKAFDCPPGQADFSSFNSHGLAGIEANCSYKLSRRLFQFDGKFELLPLQKFLKSAGFDSLDVYVLPSPFGAARCDPLPEKTPPPGAKFEGCVYLLDRNTSYPHEIRYSFGYPPTVILRDITILILLLSIPIALTFRFRRLALGIQQESKPAIVFRYFRFIRWTAFGGSLIWWTVIDLLRIDRILQFVLMTSGISNAANALVVSWILVWLPPIGVYFVCLALSSPLHSLRGVSRTQNEAIHQSFWTVARFVLPLLLFILGIVEFSDSPRLAVCLFVFAIVAGQITRRRLARAYGMELHALTAGDLRDRAFSIAQKARAKLNQLYVLPAEQIRMANAFAHAANNIFLTDYLVKNLSKREVDAILGHETTHLQKKHIRSRILVWLFWVVGMALVGIWFGDKLPSSFPAGPAIYAFLLLAIFVVSRSNEFAADAGAFKLTGDAEAIITAFARLSRLNTMPLHWGKADEQMLTHPSTMRRIKRIAKLGGISEARIPDLVNQAATPPADVYLIPPTALPAGKVFSTRFKSRISSSISWIIVLTTVLIPVLIAQIVLWTHASGSNLAIALLTGLAITIAVQSIFSNILPFMGMQKLESHLREKLRREAAPPQLSSGLFVSLSPDSRPRIYEGNWAWDAGFLSMSESSLFYCGEESRFALPRQRIMRISLGPGPVNWFNTKAVYFTWRDEAGTEHTFNLRPLGVHSMCEMARQTLKLADELDKWHRGIQSPSKLIPSAEIAVPDAQGASGPPPVGQVTAASPRALARGEHLVKIFMSDTIIAIAVFILLGFPAPFLSVTSPQSTNSDLNMLGAVFLYVLASVWIVRAALLWPHWRFREPSPETTVAP